MSVYIEPSQGKFERAPEGVHFAVCVGIWDLGTQPSELYQPTRKVMFCWELMGETDAEGKPFTITSTFTASLHEKSTLRPKIEAWRGKPLTEAETKGKFDLSQMLGKACQIQIVHKESNGKTYANVTSIMAVPKGVGAMQATTPLSDYSISQRENFPEPMPEYVRNKVRQSHEFTRANGAAKLGDELEAAYSGAGNAKPNPAANLPKITPSEPLPWETGKQEAY